MQPKRGPVRFTTGVKYRDGYGEIHILSDPHESLRAFHNGRHVWSKLWLRCDCHSRWYDAFTGDYTIYGNGTWTVDHDPFSPLLIEAKD